MMKAIVNSSFLVAVANDNGRFHAECLALAQEMQYGFIVPVTVLPEAAYLIGSRLGHHVMREFVRQMAGPGWITELVSDDDLTRTAVILEKYHDLNLDFVDATIVAIAERLNVRRVLTLDRQDFQVIRPSHCLSFELFPEISCQHLGVVTGYLLPAWELFDPNLGGAVRRASLRAEMRPRSRGCSYQTISFSVLRFLLHISNKYHKPSRKINSIVSVRSPLGP